MMHKSNNSPKQKLSLLSLLHLKKKKSSTADVDTSKILSNQLDGPYQTTKTPSDFQNEQNSGEPDVCSCAEPNTSHKRSLSLGLHPSTNCVNEEYKDTELNDPPTPTLEKCDRLRKIFSNAQHVSADSIIIPKTSNINTTELKSSRPSSTTTLTASDHLKKSENKNNSMDSLARQALFAVQVLHLIPTSDVKERNYLHGRIAGNSLLGAMELERVLHNREVRIYIGTWNMNGQAPPPELNELLLPDTVPHLPDILAIGTQESYPDKFEWEVNIQETIGPSHILFHSASLGTLHLAIYIRRDLIWFCSVPEESSFSTRPGTAFRTKGAVAISFSLFGSSILFITSHLTAHVEKVKERLQDVRRIIKSLELPKLLPVKHKTKDVTNNFDYVFWCGDLNFRLAHSRIEVMKWVTQHRFPLVSSAHQSLSDQLNDCISSGSVFKGFQEGPLTFAPTYKYDPGTEMFDTSAKQRTPSYTDRILFKCGKQILPSPTGSSSITSNIECLTYCSVPSVCTSDHKPVWGLYKCSIRPGIDTMPLAAGQFNREVYLEAIKRRAATMNKRVGTSAVCNLQ
ncbi:Endonuclease/exonuclease/phosphatase,Inositol polyphosphate-related phosphatase [Cinara cedri]|uniref:phosphoinositide 5-phosphatase n=1 Tax=Cinara cedri TaxID=506608 RepID=A0A5E4NNM5_9HEMI|nr:Endonuclease/exonuclease/phosphatase,Inositol polyphosphate-related phosphatase [Cinara cedri]